MKSNLANQRLRVILGALSINLLILACNFLSLISGSGSGSTPTAATENPPVENTSIPETVGADQATEAPVGVEVPPPEPGSTLRWLDGSLLVYVPPGEFVMGQDDEDNPEHMVYMDGFWIYRTEVTNRMYLNCMAMEECSPPAVDPALPDLEDPELADHPVVGVRWHQAEEYCQSVGGHLPTEAQWEKTARGTEGRIFPWGYYDTEPNCELLNFNDCVGRTSAVIDYPLGVSPYEVLDMAGNVFEWVSDWYQENYYSEAPFDNPMGPDHGEVRSVRGSTFRSGPEMVESALRYFLGPDEYRNDLGFRCVVGNAHEYAPPCEVLAHSPSDDLAANPDEAPGGSAACVVPEPALSVVTYCNEAGWRGNNISWTPADAEIDYSTLGSVSCDLYDEDTLSCVGDYGATVDITACKSCPPPVVELGVPAACDLPYVLQEDTSLCKYDGPPIPGRVVCAPGYSLGDDASCCVRKKGTPLDFPVCPIGGAFDPTSRICWFTLPSTGDVKCASQSVFFETCIVEEEKKHGGGGHKPRDPCADYDIAECRLHANEGCVWNFEAEVCFTPE